MIDAPISDDSDYSSDYLDEYHGRDAYYESDEENNKPIFDDPLSFTPNEANM